MAHFGVQKAKKMLVLAGATAIAGAGLVSTGNASAISPLSDLDYSCSMNDGSGSYAILLKTADAIKWAVKDQEKFYEPSSTNCYADWGSEQPNPHNVKFYIAGGNYSFDEFIERDEGSADSGIYIGNIPDVFTASEYEYESDADVTFNASSDNYGFDLKSGEAFRINITVAEESSLTIKGGKYNAAFTNDGAIAVDGGKLVNAGLYNGGTLTFSNGAEYEVTEATGFDGHITNYGDMTINGGTFEIGDHDYNINISPYFINNSGTARINGGTFGFDFKNTRGIGTEDRPYYGDPGAFIRNTGSVIISNGSFSGYGTLLNQMGDNGSINITGGDFEANYMISTHDYPDAPESTSTINITDGVFHSRKTFYLYDDKDNLPQGQGIPGETGTWGLWRDSDGNARGGMCTSQYCSSPWTFGTFRNQRVKGGDYSDGENIEPESGYAKVELDTDYDGDGKNDARIVPLAGPVSDNVDVGETKELRYHVKDGGTRPSFPENSRILSQENTEYCSAEFIDNKLYVTGHKYTEGVASKFCQITVTDDSSYVLKFSINVAPSSDYNYTEADPIVIPEGESKTPDGYDGDVEDYEWTVADGDTYCSVENGTITAVKGGGTCTVVARNEETKEVIIWNITTTSPIEIGVGESKKPEDLPEGADKGEWSSSDPSVCTVASDGTITGVKAGNCKVTLTLEDGTVYTWSVTITENPDTSDKNNSAAFTIIGAVTAGFAAMTVMARRFFGRK